MNASPTQNAGQTTGLIADIGATNARFALCDATQGIHKIITLSCADYPHITSAVVAYLEQAAPTAPPINAAFAIAGPVQGDRFAMTNFPWQFSVEDTRKALDLKSFHLMNDFEALAYGVLRLSPADLRPIGNGQAIPHQPIGIVGPGTGLGIASLIWTGTRYQAIPGEGGHATMPARTRREFDIFKTLRHKYRHVSAERVCSGKGLKNIYDTIRIIDKRLDLPERTPEDISAAALDQRCDTCMESLDLMMGFLGTIAGNLALTIGAHGGVYLAGGIPAQLADYIATSRFREEFERKGRFEDYLKTIPTTIVTHDYPAFLGLQNFIQDNA